MQEKPTPLNGSFTQSNAFAMQNGAVLGIWNVLTGAAFVASLTVTAFSLPYTLMLIFSPVLACLFTMRYRRNIAAPTEEFSFGRGYIHALLLQLYACIWLALAVYVYLAYFDHGSVFNAYETLLTRPELLAELERNGMAEQIETMTDGKGITALADALRNIPPATYSAIIIYLNIIIAPVISIIIALICRRNGARLNTYTRL